MGQGARVLTTFSWVGVPVVWILAYTRRAHYIV